jgi:galactokinase
MELFVPGRICLFGEHSDWAGGYRRDNQHIEKGYTLICGTDQGIYATIEPHSGTLVISSQASDGITIGPKEIPMKLEFLREEAQAGGYWSYVAGTAYQVLRKYPVDGLSINNHKTDLPIQKGLSSSASICVLTARAFNHQYDLGLSLDEEMELAYLGEITTPSKCGRMDQGVAFGSTAVLMTFDGDRLGTREIKPSNPIYLVIVDLGSTKDTKRILADLNRCFPDAVDEIAQGVQFLLGENNKRIVHQAVEVLQDGDAPRLGSLMTRAQSDFDRFAIPACPDELAAPLLHKVLNYPPIEAYIWGGKGVGSQGDGSAQLVVRGKGGQKSVMEILENDLGMRCYPLTVNHGVSHD